MILKNDRQSQYDRIVELSNSNKALEAKNKALNLQLVDLHSQLSAALKNAEALRQKYINSEKESVNQQKSIDDLERKLNNYRNTLKEYVDLINQLRNSEDKHAHELATMSSQLTTAEDNLKNKDLLFSDEKKKCVQALQRAEETTKTAEKDVSIINELLIKFNNLRKSSNNKIVNLETLLETKENTIKANRI